MSDQTPHTPKPGAKPDHDPKGVHHARPLHVRDRDNNVGKWLAGAAVAALVLGGGYYAVKNLPAPNSQSTEIAAYDADGSSVTPYTAGPVTGGIAATESAPSDTTLAASSASSDARPSTTNRARPKPVQTASVEPEYVVGVTPTSVDTSNSADELVITGARKPIWASTPSPRRLSAMYPSRALEREKEGEASVRCIVQANGSLDCDRVSESPARSGFGAAAVRVARSFKHAPTRYDGTAAAGTPVNLRVVFRIEDESPRRT